MAIKIPYTPSKRVFFDYVASTRDIRWMLAVLQATTSNPQSSCNLQDLQLGPLAERLE